METSTFNTKSSSTSRTGYGSTTCNIFVEGNIMSLLETTIPATITKATTTNSSETTYTKSSSTGYQTISSIPSSSSPSKTSASTSSTSSTSSSNSCESLYSITEVHKVTTKPGFQTFSRLLTMEVDIKSRAIDKEDKQFLARLEPLLNIINHILIGFITIYMSWLCLHKQLQSTALHAWLVTLGFTCLMAEALMCYYNHNILTVNVHRKTKTLLHWLLQLLGGTLGIAGVLYKCIQKGFLLKTVHGIIGFIAFVLCCVSLCSGLAALYSIKLKQRLNPLLNKTFHNLLGLTTFIVTLISQYFGYETGFFKRQHPIDFIILMQCLTLLILILTCIGPLKAFYYKCNNLLRHYH